jgi:Gpi18-like mannosyltransferase
MGSTEQYVMEDPMSEESLWRLGNRNRDLLRQAMPYIVVVFALRLLLTFIQPYAIDMGGYMAWSSYLAKNGPSQLYGSSGFHIVYAPFYQYFLWLTGEVVNILSLSKLWHAYLIKLWSVIFEFIGGFIIYKLGQKYNRPQAGLMAGLVYAINPGVWINSSVWGQFDAIPATMLLGMLYLFEIRRPNLAALLFLIAVLTKPQSGLLVPVVLVLYFKDFRLDKKSLLRLGTGLISGIALYLAIVLPFYIPTAKAHSLPRFIDPFYWLFDLYARSIQDYPFGTANAFNLWTLLGGQIQKDTLPFMGLTYFWWGNILLILGLAFAFFLLLRGGPRLYTFAYFSFLVQFSAFMFMTKMHERYLLPAIIFITLCTVFDKRHILTAALTSFCVFFNHLYLYILSFSGQYWLERYDILSIILAFITLVTYSLAVYQGYRIFIGDGASKSRVHQGVLK